MGTYQKIYIYTTGVNKNKIVFRDLPHSFQIQHPIPPAPIHQITQDNVMELFDLTANGTVNAFLNSNTFKQGLKLDWFRAFNEFGIEIDNFQDRTFETDLYGDGQIPVWDAVEKTFKPTTVSILPTYIPPKLTELTCIANLLKNTVINISSVTSTFTFKGVAPDLRADATAFNNSLNLKILRNGIPLLKGTEVTRISNTSVSFDFDLYATEVIFIES